MKEKYCFGITDQIFWRKDQKKTKYHVFFFEIDNPKKSFFFFKKLMEKIKMPLCIFETKNGFHFVSPAIFQIKEYKYIWKIFKLWFPKSDYKENIKPHILRLGWKCNNSPPPKLIYSYLPKNKTYSRANLKAFKIPYKGQQLQTKHTFTKKAIYKLGKKGMLNA